MPIAKTLAEIREELGDEVSLIYKDVSREPYIKSKHGYRGDIVTKKEDDIQLLQCHECGEYFEDIGHHIRTHHIKAAEYKEEHGLAQNIPLVSKKISRKLSKRAVENSAKVYKNLKKGRSIKGRKRRTSQPTSVLNKHGTCSDAQIKARMQILANIVGRSPSFRDAREYDGGLEGVLRHRYGSWNEGKKRLGFETYNQGNEHDDESLIGFLRKYTIDNGRVPECRTTGPKSEFENEYLVSIRSYFKHFGSWKKAKALAGLDQILAQIKEDNKPGSLKPIFKKEFR